MSALGAGSRFRQLQTMGLTMAIRRRNRRRRQEKRLLINAAPAELLIEGSAGDVTIEAAAADGAGGPAKFTMVAYTGKPMPRQMEIGGADHPDISAMRKPASGRVPIHRDHKPDKVVGHSETIQAKGGRVVIQDVLSASNDHSREVLKPRATTFRGKRQSVRD